MNKLLKSNRILKIISIIFLLVTLLNENSYSQSGWTIQNSGTFENLNDIKFIDINTGWAVGNAGVVLKTTNGGTNWVSIYTGYNLSNYSLQLLTENTLYIGCYNSKYIKSSNGGVNWVSVSTSTNNNGYIGSIHFLSEVTGYVSWNSTINNIDYLYITTNSGLNWDFSGSRVSRGKLFFIPGSSQGWIVGDWVENYINYGITSNGLNWNYGICGGGTKLNGVHFITSTQGYTVGELGKIYKSTNGGISWILQNSPVSNNLRGVASKDPNNSWAIGESGIILNTTNSGTNWMAQLSPTTQNLNSIYFPFNSNIGWVCGNQGIILKTINGGVGVKQISSSVPSEYKLYQNYPNPFNPTTNIKFQVPKNSFVKLELYDINGKHISTLVSEQLNSGTYEFTIDGSKLSSGTYFVKLEVSNLHLTKKIVLSK